MILSQISSWGYIYVGDNTINFQYAALNCYIIEVAIDCKCEYCIYSTILTLTFHREAAENRRQIVGMQ